MQHIIKYLSTVNDVCNKISREDIDKVVQQLSAVKKRGGRLFILGVGGSSANASHAVNDFRKISGIETYAPTDNVSELTARTNDNGWETIFIDWLETSKANQDDCVMVLSVGGGSETTSRNLVEAIKFSHSMDIPVIGIVSRDGGYTRVFSVACVVIPMIYPELVTPMAESFQSVLLHLLATHPAVVS